MTDNSLIKYATVKVNDIELKLCYSFGAIVQAEQKLPNINLLTCFTRLSELKAGEFLALLWAAALKAQPKMTMDEIASLVSIDNQPVLMEALAQAYILSLPEKKDDSEAEEQSPLAQKSATD